ncbi:MAG: phosphotransferase enzyme family protein [Nocardioidaceae bacterium]
MSTSEVVPRDAQVAPTLPLPAGPWGIEHALAAVAEARDAMPFDLGETTLVSVLTTVVLRCGEYAVKVYPPGTDASHLNRLAHALAGSCAAHLPLCPPLVTTHGVLTVSRWLRETRPVSWRELGALLRDFHAEHAHADVPEWQPLSRLASQVEGLTDESAAILLGARDSLLDALAEVHSELGEGTIHGDVSPSNVMHAPTGPRLIDLDWVGRAPREYDLSSASRRVADGEISLDAYKQFCTAYDFDVRSWPGLPLLNRIADLGGVAFRLWDSRHHGLDLDWVDDEVRVWRFPL